MNYKINCFIIITTQFRPGFNEMLVCKITFFEMFYELSSWNLQLSISYISRYVSKHFIVCNYCKRHLIEICSMNMVQQQLSKPYVNRVKVSVHITFVSVKAQWYMASLYDYILLLNTSNMFADNTISFAISFSNIT